MIFDKSTNNKYKSNFANFTNITTFTYYFRYLTPIIPIDLHEQYVLIRIGGKSRPSVKSIKRATGDRSGG